MRVAVFLVISVVSLPLMAQDCALCGKWRSNEAKTLADIEARVPSYPTSLRKMIGKLNLEYSAKAVRIHMDGDPKPDEITKRFAIIRPLKSTKIAVGPDRNVEMHLFFLRGFLGYDQKSYLEQSGADKPDTTLDGQ